MGSCSHHNNYINFVKSRQSFVKIEMIAYDNTCLTSLGCDITFIIGSGSGSHVLVKGKKYILTAGHICNKDDAILQGLAQGRAIDIDIFAIDLDENRYLLQQKKINLQTDLCLLINESLNTPTLELAMRPPEIGDKVFNFAAPAGIFKRDMVPIIDGIYNGKYYNNGAYTLAAMGGSSGSPIVDRHGNLIGMVHSVHSRFPYFSLSPTYYSLRNFLFSP